jgi:hypothetical protein
MKEPIDGEGVSLASFRDPRVEAIRVEFPMFAEWVTRFTNAFGVALEPVVLIVRKDMTKRLNADALLSFRDLVAMSVVPLSRSLNTVYSTTNRIVYADSFWIYPWTLSADLQHLIAMTPAFTGFHSVDHFHGQSSPELPHMTVSELDQQLLAALLARWKRHYLGKRQRWEDRALFRSLNMAGQAAQLPGGVGVTIFASSLSSTSSASNRRRPWRLKATRRVFVEARRLMTDEELADVSAAQSAGRTAQTPIRQPITSASVSKAQIAACDVTRIRPSRWSGVRSGKKAVLSQIRRSALYLRHCRRWSVPRFCRLHRGCSHFPVSSRPARSALPEKACTL